MRNDIIPDDWKQLPSGLFVKVWTARDLEPEKRTVITKIAHGFADSLGWRLVTHELLHRDCTPDHCAAEDHNPSFN